MCEIFLVYIENTTSSNIHDLKGTKQASKYVRNSLVPCRLSCLKQFNFEVLSHDIDQIPNNLNVDILGKLAETQENRAQ